MSMEITNYANYAAQSMTNSVMGKANKAEKAEDTKANKSADNSKTANNKDYMKSLEKLASSVKFGMGTCLSSEKTGKTLNINPKLLEKMQNDPKKEKEMNELITGIEKAMKMVEARNKMTGMTTTYHHWYIDENGTCWSTSQTVKEDLLNKKLRKEAQENAEKQIEKSRENARKKAKELEEQLEEKAEESKKTDSKQDDSVTVVKKETAQDKAEKLLSDKLDKAENGEIFLDNEDTKVIIEAAKEYGLDKPNAKEQATVGGRIDLQV